MKTRLKGLLSLWLAVIMMVGMVIPAAADSTPKIRFVNSSNPYFADVEISDDGGTTWRKPTDSDNVSYQWYETEEIAWSYSNYLYIPDVDSSPGSDDDIKISSSNNLIQIILCPGDTITLTPSSNLTDPQVTFYSTAEGVTVNGNNVIANNDIYEKVHHDNTDSDPNINVYQPAPNSDGSYSFTNNTENYLHCVVEVSGSQPSGSTNNDFFRMTGTKAVPKTGWTSNSLLNHIGSETPNGSYSCKATYGGSSAFGAPVNYQKPTITINYGEGGGSITHNGILTEAPASKPVEGKLFAGWYTDAALTKPCDFSNPITSSISLYAKYVTPTKRSRVSFVADGRLVAIVLYRDSQSELTYIPKVPKKEGYVGTWEAYTLNGENMIVRAVYTQE